MTPGRCINRLWLEHFQPSVDGTAIRRACKVELAALFADEHTDDGVRKLKRLRLKLRLMRFTNRSLQSFKRNKAALNENFPSLTAIV